MQGWKHTAVNMFKSELKIIGSECDNSWKFDMMISAQCHQSTESVLREHALLWLNFCKVLKG